MRPCQVIVLNEPIIDYRPSAAISSSSGKINVCDYGAIELIKIINILIKCCHNRITMNQEFPIIKIK